VFRDECWVKAGELEVMVGGVSGAFEMTLAVPSRHSSWMSVLHSFLEVFPTRAPSIPLPFGSCYP
jgi:hypothetical protein